MKSRVSSTVTKRQSNPRPRKYASASERQAAYRSRAPEVCFRAEPKTVETLDRIADTLDQSRADVLLSMTKFALANHDWARFGLTHKPLPFEYGVNPIMKTPARKTTTKRKPTPAQLAARERFAEMARSGAFKKTGGRKANPVGNLANLKKRYQTVLLTMADLREALKRRKKGLPDDDMQGYSDAEVSALITKYQAKAQGLREAIAMYEGQRKANPVKAERVRRNPAPAKQRMGRIVRVDPKTGVPFGTELVPIDFTFKEWVGNYQQDFFARTEGAQLVVSEKTTGAKVGAVPFTLRSAALNDRAAAKAFVQKTVEKVGADRFNAAIAKAPKLTA